MRSIGIDPGDQAVKVVEVDGSYKRTRLLGVRLVPAAAPGADVAVRAEVVAAAARQALDEGMRGEVALGHPCREAVLRTIELPFKGSDAIRKVVKAEIEGEIQSQSVDDMVVDFHEIGEGQNGGTRILVASVPKASLRAQLAALTGHAIEPEHVDLDTMALWRAAHWAGAFEPEAFAASAAEPGAAAAAATGGGGATAARVTVVVDIGARSVRVLLVAGEHLVEMRALRLGDAVVAEDIARRHGLDAMVAREAAYRCLTTGADERLEVAAEALATGKEEGAEAAPKAPARTVVVSRAEVDAAHTAWLQRLARELTRFLTASGRAGQVVGVVATGGASRTPGTREMLAAVFGVEVKELDLLGKLQHELTPEQVTEYGPRLATALGLALGALGGPAGFELRQEDLVLTRGFERIKFPLAIACMVALLALFVTWNKKSMELRNLELQIGSTYTGGTDPKAPPIFYGMLNSVFSSRWFEKPEHFRLEQQKGKDFTWKDLAAELAQAPVHKRLALVRDRLKAVADQKQKESGIYEDVSLESGLAVLVRWSEMMRATEAQLGRFLVTSIHLNMHSRTRKLEFTIAFRGEDFRSRRSVLQRAIEAEIQKADSPFETPDKAEDRKDEELFRDADKGGMPGAYYKVTMHVKDVFQPFGPSGGTAVGVGPARPEMLPDVAKDLLAATGGK